MSTKRVVYFDLLNVAACIAVVALHCNQMVHTWQPGKNWLLAMAIETVFYWAVPIFFMLTGATLMRYRERYDTRTFIEKRVKRTVIPFVAWSLILFLVVSVPLGGAHLGIRTFLNMMLNNQIEQVYWFFFPLFSLYLALPMISLLADNKKVILYGVMVSFALVSVLPYLCQLGGVNWNGAISIPSFGGMLLYVGLGYLLSSTDLDDKTTRTFYALGILGTIFRFVYTAVMSESIGAVDRLFFNYSAFPAVLQAVAVFLLFKNLNLSRLQGRVITVLSELSACSFGVYLIHKPVLDHVVLGLMNVPMQSVALRTVGVLVLYAACVLTVFLLKKVPLVKAIIP